MTMESYQKLFDMAENLLQTIAKTQENLGEMLHLKYTLMPDTFQSTYPEILLGVFLPLLTSLMSFPSNHEALAPVVH